MREGRKVRNKLRKGLLQYSLETGVALEIGEMFKLQHQLGIHLLITNTIYLQLFVNSGYFPLSYCMIR